MSNGAPFGLTRLLGVIGIEVVGILVVAWGLVEMYYLGGNPVRPQLLIPLGSLILATGTLWFSKIYSGPDLWAKLRVHSSGGEAAGRVARSAVFLTILGLALVGLVALVLVGVSFVLSSLPPHPLGFFL